MQTPAPFHPIQRGRAGPNLLAEVIMAKFGLHLPLHRQNQRFVQEGIPIDVSTLAGWVGAVTTALSPLVSRIEAHVRGAERLHLDDTPVPVLAKGGAGQGPRHDAVKYARHEKHGGVVGGGKTRTGRRGIAGIEVYAEAFSVRFIDKILAGEISASRRKANFVIKS